MTECQLCPGLARDQALEVTAIHSVSGRTRLHRPRERLGSFVLSHRRPGSLFDPKRTPMTLPVAETAAPTHPSIILADEPTGNLDTASTGDVLALFGRLNTEGRTVVMITHEADVADHAKRVIRLRDGQVIEDRRQAPVAGPPPGYQGAAPTLAAALNGQR
jgi:putative ABC transport system ATP-binding protein